MGARIPMSSGYGHGKKLKTDAEVCKSLGQPRLVRKAVSAPGFDPDDMNEMAHRLARGSSGINRAKAKVVGAPARAEIKARHALRTPLRRGLATGGAIYGGLVAAGVHAQNKQLKTAQANLKAAQTNAKTAARAASVNKALPMIGKGRLIRGAGAQACMKENRRSELQGGGSAFIPPIAEKHPFGAAFGATLIALRTINGQPVRGY